MAQRLTITQRRDLRKEARQLDEMSDKEFNQLFDEGRPVRVRLRRPAPKTITVSLDQPTLDRLKRLARRKQVGPHPTRKILFLNELIFDFSLVFF